MSNQLSWGILGTGGIASKFADQLPQTDSGTLAAVGSRSAAAADEFTGQYGGRPLDSYQAVLEDGDVQAVYISLPNSMHHEWSIRALQAGKHVLCEKPIASNVTQAEEMFEVAQREGRVLVEAFMYRHQPVIRRVLDEIHSGIIGELKIIRSHFTFNRPADPVDIRYQPQMAGGSIMDVGCYCINLSRALTRREPSSVHAVAHLCETGVDEWAAGTLDFDGQVLGVFTCGMTVPLDRTTYVGGTDGHLELPDPWFSDGSYTLVRGDDRQTVQELPPKGSYAMEADGLASVLQNGSTPCITPADSLGNMHVLDQLRSAVGLSY